MSEFVLSCCSTADLTHEHFESHDIKYVRNSYYLDGVRYEDDLWQSMSPEEFYKRLADGAETKTSQVTVSEFSDYFRTFLEDGKDVLHLCLSSGLSGTYNSASIAAGELSEEFPDRKIYVVDSLGASSGYGLLMITLADMRDEGKSIDECYEWAKEHCLNMHYWFCSQDLTQYIRGGRVSKTAGVFGTVLGICPVLHCDGEGKLIPKKKVRGKNAAVKSLVEKMEEYADNGIDYNNRCYICHSNCIEDAKALRETVQAKFTKIKGDIIINNIGPTIGSHSGSGTVAVFFFGEKR